ncbi:transposase [Xanthomonas theicola]|nr:transposase [Xanthomonas theicola]
MRCGARRRGRRRPTPRTATADTTRRDGAVACRPRGAAPRPGRWMVLRRQTVEWVLAELMERRLGRRFPLRGAAAAATEMALAVLSCNLERLRSLLGDRELIGRLQAA